MQMMSEQSHQTQQSKKERRVNQLKLLGVFAIAGVPVVLAMIMYFGGFAIPTGKTNKGNLLVPPISLGELGFQQTSDGVYSDSHKDWLIMVVGTGECATECTELLHMTRQVNVAMGREMDRVSRIVVTSAQSQLPSNLSESYPHLAVHIASSELQSAFIDKAKYAGANQDLSPGAWGIWIVDPLGNIMMEYDASHDGYDLIGDLKKLLKLSNIG
jgi:hypothetical protein